MPYVVKLADEGVHTALKSDPGFLEGLNVAAGEVTYAPVAADQGLTAVDPLEALDKVPAAA
jgi:alanine dehydrogenase